MLILMLMIFFLPNNSTGQVSNIVNSIIINIPDVNNQSSQSNFPFATAIVYLLILFLSPFFAVFLCLTSVHVTKMRQIMSEQPVNKIWIILVLIIIYLLPFFMELDAKNAQKSKAFWDATLNYKFAFLLYMETMFIVYVFSWALVLDEATNLTKTLTRK